MDVESFFMVISYVMMWISLALFLYFAWVVHTMLSFIFFGFEILFVIFLWIGDKKV